MNSSHNPAYTQSTSTTLKRLADSQEDDKNKNARSNYDYLTTIEDPGLNVYLTQPIDIPSQTFSEILDSYHTIIESKNNMLLMNFMSQYPILLNWFYGQPCNFGTAEFPQIKRITILELAEEFEFLLKYQSQFMVEFFWNNFSQLKEWYLGRNVVLAETDFIKRLTLMLQGAPLTLILEMLQNNQWRYNLIKRELMKNPEGELKTAMLARQINLGLFGIEQSKPNTNNLSVQTVNKKKKYRTKKLNEKAIEKTNEPLEINEENLRKKIEDFCHILLHKDHVKEAWYKLDQVVRDWIFGKEVKFETEKKVIPSFELMHLLENMIISENYFVLDIVVKKHPNFFLTISTKDLQHLYELVLTTHKDDIIQLIKSHLRLDQSEEPFPWERNNNNVSVANFSVINEIGNGELPQDLLTGIFQTDLSQYRF